MDGERGDQFLGKLLPLRFALGRSCTGRSVSQLDQRNYGDGDLGLADFASDVCEHLPGVLALALGCDQKAGVEDQSHVSEASGSR